MAETAITSSFLIAAMVLLRGMWKEKISRRIQYALWLLVAVRLLAPATLFHNPLQILNVVHYTADGGKQLENGAERRSLYPGKQFHKEADTGRIP